EERQPSETFGDGGAFFPEPFLEQQHHRSDKQQAIRQAAAYYGREGDVVSQRFHATPACFRRDLKARNARYTSDEKPRLAYRPTRLHNPWLLGTSTPIHVSLMLVRCIAP